VCNKIPRSKKKIPNDWRYHPDRLVRRPPAHKLKTWQNSLVQRWNQKDGARNLLVEGEKEKQVSKELHPKPTIRTGMVVHFPEEKQENPVLDGGSALELKANGCTLVDQPL
jgi:hypothetical protein